MKIALVALNASYVHQNIAIQYLKAVLPEKHQVSLVQLTTNQKRDEHLQQLNFDWDLIGFSVYIWNRDQILSLAQTLKTIYPNRLIFFGGPEVSFDTESLMIQAPWVDMVIRGEGELIFPEMIEALVQGKSLAGLPGLVWRDQGGIHSAKQHMAPSPSTWPVLYHPQASLPDPDRIAYIEGSRGCPYACAFCLSSAVTGVRYLPLDDLLPQLLFLLKARVKLIKFIDRSFAVNHERAMKILDFLIAHDNGISTFHMEVNAAALKFEWIQRLAGARKGLIQLEIGVQSTYQATCEAIHRVGSFEAISSNVKSLGRPGNVNLHLDLIAGLPYESKHRFLKSFDDVYALRPDDLQLGFLKLLRGTELRQDAEKLGLKFDSQAPYEILATPDISYEELRQLKIFEDVFERFYGDRFKYTLRYLERIYGKPSAIFKELACFFEKKQLVFQGVREDRLYQLCYECFKDACDSRTLSDLLRIDWVRTHDSSSQRLELFSYPNFSKKSVHTGLHQAQESGWCIHLTVSDLLRYGEVIQVQEPVEGLLQALDGTGPLPQMAGETLFFVFHRHRGRNTALSDITLEVML